MADMEWLNIYGTYNLFVTSRRMCFKGIIVLKELHFINVTEKQRIDNAFYATAPFSRNRLNIIKKINEKSISFKYKYNLQRNII